jgi:hypothetical protein
LAWLSYEAVPAVPSPDQEVLKAISLDLTGVRQHLAEIATQLTVDHEQMTRDITRRLVRPDANLPLQILASLATTAAATSKPFTFP